jgi:hypothetical protein
MNVNTIKRKALQAARRGAILWQPNPIVLPQFDAFRTRVIHYRWHDAAHNGDGWREPFLTELAAWEDALRFYEQICEAIE